MKVSQCIHLLAFRVKQEPSIKRVVRLASSRITASVSLNKACYQLLTRKIGSRPDMTEKC